MIGVRDSKIRKNLLAGANLALGKNLTTACMSLNRMKETKMEESKKERKQETVAPNRLSGKKAERKRIQ